MSAWLIFKTTSASDLYLFNIESQTLNTAAFDPRLSNQACNRDITGSPVCSLLSAAGVLSYPYISPAAYLSAIRLLPPYLSAIRLLPPEAGFLLLACLLSLVVCLVLPLSPLPLCPSSCPLCLSGWRWFGRER